MFKIDHKLALCCLTLVWLFTGCMQKPTDPAGQVWIDLKLNYRDDSEHVPGLLKANRLIDDQVLLLNFNEGSGDSVYDQSPYQNHAVLNDSTIWGSLDLKSSISIESRESYAAIYSNPVLNGTHGLTIATTLYLYYESVTGERIIVDKHDDNGGYTLGIDRGNHLFLRVRNDLREKEVVSDSVLSAGQWHTIIAKYTTRPLAVTVLRQTDTDTTGMPATLPLTWSPLIIGAANNQSGLYINPLQGLIDNLSITTTSNFVDFDFVRVAVMDLNKFIQSDSLRRMSIDSLMAYFSKHDSTAVRYIREMHRIFHRELENAPVPTWATLRYLWDSYFTVISEQNLRIDGGFAAGTINGIPGLNLIAVSALRNNIPVYYGEALVWGRKDHIATVAVDMSTLEYEYQP